MQNYIIGGLKVVIYCIQFKKYIIHLLWFYPVIIEKPFGRQKILKYNFFSSFLVVDFILLQFPELFEQTYAFNYLK